MWRWLKNKLGYGESSEPVQERREVTSRVEKRVGQCGHTDVTDYTRSFTYPPNNWMVESGHLLIPQETAEISQCEQCGTELTWETVKDDTLAFKPSFTVAPDVTIEEALSALESPSAQSDGESIIINRSENPTETET